MNLKYHFTAIIITLIIFSVAGGMSEHKTTYDTVIIHKGVDVFNSVTVTGLDVESAKIDSKGKEEVKYFLILQIKGTDEVKKKFYTEQYWREVKLYNSVKYTDYTFKGAFVSFVRDNAPIIGIALILWLCVWARLEFKNSK